MNLKVNPTCFGSYEIHHQGIHSRTWLKITRSGSQTFIMC